MISNFEQVLVPELNNGQLIKIIRDQYFVDAAGYNKIQGIPFTRSELMQKMRDLLEEKEQPVPNV
jgi:2-oxoglutarate ferredoxin oxidoreductase subunit alpha